MRVQNTLAVTFPSHVFNLCSAFFNDLPQLHIWLLESVSSPNCALRLIRILAGSMFPMIRNLRIMLCATVEGARCSLVVITTDIIKQSGMQRYVITIIVSPL
jgi:hypothetical protein